jgi:ketol-acid reductoisomerase
MTKIFYDKDIDISVIKKRKVGIIGYGAQGHAQAQNLRDSGVEVIVSDIPNSANWNRAKEDGFTPVTTKEAAATCDFIQLLVPDNLQPVVYQEDIAPQLKENDVLGFSHGFNIHFGQIQPLPYIDVVMVAPKGPGTLLRKLYQEEFGIPALVAIYQDYSKNAKELALAYAKAIGSARVGVIETTFKEETETDLFGEQVVLCGGVTALILSAFEVLVEAGYQPEIAYFECCHELKLIVDLIYEKGISGMREIVSDTAEYGDLTRGRRVINQEVKNNMKIILEEIQSGRFAREWILENKTGRVVYNALKKKDKEHLLETIGEKLRQMMRRPR